jgi:hypothetical protein
VPGIGLLSYEAEDDLLDDFAHGRS